MENKSQLKTFFQNIHIRETLHGGSVFLVIKILGTFGAYFFAWYISRVYGPEGNGILAFTITLAVLLAALYNLGLNTYVVKIIPQFRQQSDTQALQIFIRKVFSIVKIITFSGSLILLGLSYIVSSDTLSRDLYLVSFLSIPVSTLLLISHMYKARKNMYGFSLLQNNIIQTGALLILILPFWTGINPSEPVWACVLAGVLMTVIGMTFNRIPKPTKEILSSTRFTNHVRESLPMLAGGLAFIILNLTDRLMLRFLDSTSQLGIYDIVLRLSNITLIGMLSLNAMAEPKFAEFFASKNPEGLRRYVSRMTWIGLVISLPVILLLGVFPEFWLGFFGLGDDFISGHFSLHILLIGQLVSVICGAVLVLLNMTGHQGSVQSILIAAAILNIILNAILIPVMGIEGAAWATTISTILWNIWALVKVRQKLGFWMWNSE